jgi:hydrogenase maturation protein HypF
MSSQELADRERRAIAVSGVVQGVGFRPFVYGLALRLGVRGFVKNRLGGVIIEAEGDSSALDHFTAELKRGPPLSRIEEVQWAAQPVRGETGFRIEESEAAGAGAVFISPDVATCDDCLREMFDPSDRRYRYPFLNCTNCGPRLTIVRGAPYDRERTTMAAFALCGDCRQEYDDPRDRRFHAQPIACPACGPRLRALDGKGRPTGADDPIGWARALLEEGKIGAIKGLGGWHLACDARSGTSAAELRRRKHRDEKPFALMVRDLAAAEALCELSRGERELLLSPARPIVLMRRRAGVPVAEAVAPHTPLLGLMLPYTPLHHLLLENSAALVMTSGNRSNEPIAFDDSDALARLEGIADFFLAHDRPIHSRCDDSVVRVVSSAPVHFRRSRGHAPLPVRLPAAVKEPTLALGGELKSTFALADGTNGFLSHHLGDLEHAAAFRAYAASIAHYEALYRIAPRRVVHDLHPDYASTRYALERGLPRLAVQHHHAHMASCLAENAVKGEAIGVCFDGMGFGADGTLWGGEFLVGDCRSFRRAAHLGLVPMPGGEQATREPWRMAVAHLRAAGEDPGPIAARVGASALRTVERMIERSFNAPLTSSMGRLFDAVAAIAGVCDTASFEGQGAIRLESLAVEVDACGAYAFGFEIPQLDARPVVAEVAREVRGNVPAAVIARRFHAGVASLIARVCERLRSETGIDQVVLTGGVFMNAVLLRESLELLEARGFHAFRHRLVPPNDGGLSLGQLAVAAAQDAFLKE